MLHYAEFGLSHLEVPGERALCIYISGCLNHCSNCHYPELQRRNYGEPLSIFYKAMLELYASQATCVCFLGEGGGTDSEKHELLLYAKQAHYKGLKTCLYSGRDTEIEPWMSVFDWIKLGSYQEELGGLTSPHTNQRMYRKTSDGYQNITDDFWK